MPSVLPAYQFDVFVSYRHNEAILEWVKEFSSKLQQELDTTLKENLSIYYYNIETEGNLAYQEMEQAITEKLKAVIFIPIISTGYCDPKKDAWLKEFMTFKQIASNDDIGLNVQVGNGNQLSRILPVMINHVEQGDIKQIENEIGGFIRSIDFIYEGMEGVNRPLRSRDDDVLARKSSTLYRNQINKTANEISKTIRQAKVKLGIEVSGQPQVSTKEKEHTNTSLTPTANGDVAKQTVFLGWTAEDCIGKRDELALILQKAG
ncbi:MAG: hypothetical protein JKY33_07670, partial [Bacteroidia bacterium]|nr:hypothetical protein [Bacteroidia bacterium]